MLWEYTEIIQLFPFLAMNLFYFFDIEGSSKDSIQFVKLETKLKKLPNTQASYISFQFSSIGRVNLLQLVLLAHPNKIPIAEKLT